MSVHRSFSIEAVLQEAVNHLADAFEKDEDINAVDLLEWFSEWRRKARRALEKQSI